MTAQELADRYWQQAATSHRLDKAIAAAKRFKVDPDDVVRLIASANA